MTGLCHSRTPLLNNTLAKTGAIKIEKVSAPSRAKATVKAMGLNNRPSTRCSVKIGMYEVQRPVFYAIAIIITAYMPAFDALQREDRHVRRDNDSDGIKHWPLHLMRRLAN